jgi:hypothetical protein
VLASKSLKRVSPTSKPADCSRWDVQRNYSSSRMFLLTRMYFSFTWSLLSFVYNQTHVNSIETSTNWFWILGTVILSHFRMWYSVPNWEPLYPWQNHWTVRKPMVSSLRDFDFVDRVTLLFSANREVIPVKKIDKLQIRKQRELWAPN